MRLRESKAQLRFEKALRTSRYYVIPSKVEESQILVGTLSLIPSDFAASPTAFSNRSGQLSASASRSDIENSSSRPDCRCSEKIQCWSEVPQIRAKDCAGAHDQVADQIVRANHLPAAFWVRVAYD